MMNEDEVYKILETTKKKIAISQFKKERIEQMRDKKENKFIVLKKIGIGTAAGILLTVGSVGAYVGITGNTEILKKIGINIGEQYEAEKQSVEGTIYGNGFTANLVSAACDSSCIVLEVDVKLDENKYKGIDFKIDNLTLMGDSLIGSTNTGLKLSEDSVSTITENGTIKLFKYISIKDPNLESDGILDEIFANSNKANCKIEFSKLYDSNSKESISDGKWEWNFTLEGKEKSEFVKVDKNINVENVSVNIESVSKSSLGNYITLIATQDKFDSNKENNIQKLEYSIKNSTGKEINIVSKTYNITQEQDNTSKIAIETTLKLDDISDDIDYDIDVRIGEKTNIATSEITDVIKSIETTEMEEIRETKETKEDEKQEEVQSTVIKQDEMNKIVNKNQTNSSILLKFPLDRELIITTKFGTNGHNGIDLAAQEGESIYSINEGEVEDVGFNMERGKYIIIKYSDDIQVVYGACSEILKDIGDKVNTGDVIAKTGSTDFSTGPHLHFEILANGIQKNPEDYIK